jgi:hypothetical protein
MELYLHSPVPFNDLVFNYLNTGKRYLIHLLLLFFSHEVRLSPLGIAVTVLPIVPAPDDR